MSEEEKEEIVPFEEKGESYEVSPSSEIDDNEKFCIVEASTTSKQAPPTLDDIEKELSIDPFQDDNGIEVVHEREKDAPTTKDATTPIDPEGILMTISCDSTSSNTPKKDSTGAVPSTSITTYEDAPSNYKLQNMTNSTKKKWIWNGCFVIMLILVLVVIIQTVRIYNLQNEDEDAIVLPTPVPSPQTPSQQTPPPTQDDDHDLLVFLADISADGGEALRDRNSPQYAAYLWLSSSNNSNFGNILLEQEVVQKYALATLYYSTGGENWTDNYSFLGFAGGEDNECLWQSWFGGVNCREQTIVEIVLERNNLQGTLPAEIGLLTNLVIVNFQSNNLSGRIPEELGYLTRLSTLQLQRNGLTGNMPETICRQTQSAGWGDLSVDCDKVTCDCCTICCWELDQDRFNCEYLTLPPQPRTSAPSDPPFPTSLNFPTPSPSSNDDKDLKQFLVRISPDAGRALRDPSSPQFAAYLWLARVDNIFQSYTDQRVAQRYALATIYYSTDGDNWAGQAPFLNSRVGECDWELQVGGIYCIGDTTEGLSLGYNNLVGTIPPEVALLSDLSDISFYENKLRGTIPVEMSEMRNLVQVDFRFNYLTGNIPHELGKLTKLTYLSLAGNTFTGDIPDEVCELKGNEFFNLVADCDEVACSCCTFCCYESGGNQDCEEIEDFLGY